MRTTLREKRRLDEIARTDPQRAVVESLGGKLVDLTEDMHRLDCSIRRETALQAFRAKAYAPGCGRMFTPSGLNGGTMPCGDKLKGLTGKVTTEFCHECKRMKMDKQDELMDAARAAIDEIIRDETSGLNVKMDSMCELAGLIQCKIARIQEQLSHDN